MSYPENYKYTKEHEWVLVEGTTAKIGITDYAQAELGELVFVELPELGSEISKGDSVCVVESTKAASDVYAPISGKIIKVNEALNDSPALINQEPHTNGWIVEIENVQEKEIGELMSRDEYEKLIA